MTGSDVSSVQSASSQGESSTSVNGTGSHDSKSQFDDGNSSLRRSSFRGKDPELGSITEDEIVDIKAQMFDAESRIQMSRLTASERLSEEGSESHSGQVPGSGSYTSSDRAYEDSSDDNN